VNILFLFVVRYILTGKDLSSDARMGEGKKELQPLLRLQALSVSWTTKLSHTSLGAKPHSVSQTVVKSSAPSLLCVVSRQCKTLMHFEPSK